MYSFKRWIDVGTAEQQNVHSIFLIHISKAPGTRASWEHLGEILIVTNN